MPSPGISFDGLSNYNNIDAYGVVIIPPDMIGDVGPNHYVQAVNALVRVYDKSGDPLTPPFKMSELFGPLNTPCSVRNDGEATVLYDQLADRWLLSQYCTLFPPFRQMIAISKTGDPTGAYFVYEFVMPNVRLNDVAKFGVWPDGYYMSTDEFIGSDFAGSGMFAFDRNKMLAGDPTVMEPVCSRKFSSVADWRRRSRAFGIPPPPTPPRKGEGGHRGARIVLFADALCGCHRKGAGQRLRRVVSGCRRVLLGWGYGGGGCCECRGSASPARGSH